MSDLVQAIAIQKNAGSHEDVVRAVTLASVLAWTHTPEDPRWKAWLAGRFTKSVRRGTAGQIATAQEEAVSIVGCGEAVAYGFVPSTYEDMSKPLSKMQVSGSEFERSGQWIVEAEGPVIYINSDIEMSTGKTAAQAAHGLFAWALRSGPIEVENWGHACNPVSMIEVNARDLRELANMEGAVPITDAGFTEIDPGTMTVVAL